MKLRISRILPILLMATMFGISACASSGAADSDTQSDNQHFNVGDDAALESRIRKIIREDSAFIGDRIRVEVEQGVVTLTGSVSNKLDASRLERKIREIEEVRGINMGLRESAGRF